MGLIERIKSALGLGTAPSSSQSATSSTDSPSAGDGVDVTVEHDPATASEDAVKGTDTAEDGGSTADVETPAAPDTASAEAGGSDEADEADGSDGPEPASTDPAPDAELEDIKGIGPTYGERLREVGVEGVGALADADSAALAEETDIAESRVEDWVEQAKLY